MPNATINPASRRIKVWLENTNITPFRPMKKLAEKRYGPFEILETIVFRLQLKIRPLGKAFTLYLTKSS